MRAVPARVVEPVVSAGFVGACWTVSWLFFVGPGLEGAISLALVFTLAAVTAGMIAGLRRTPVSMGSIGVVLFLATTGFMDVAQAMLGATFRIEAPRQRA